MPVVIDGAHSARRQELEPAAARDIYLLEEFLLAATQRCGWLSITTLVDVELRYLYVGSADTETDVAAWLQLPGARQRWRFVHFGADVAAIDVGGRPVVLLADHRPPGSVLPIYATDDLDDAIGRLEGGWVLELGPMGTPEGPACVLRNESGATIAVLQVDRPDAMEAAYADRANTYRVLPPTTAG
jgi:hypothetical protein